MITWLLAGFDVLENPYPFELYSSRAGRLPDHGHAATPGGDFVYSADHSRLHHSHFAEQRPASLLIGSTPPWLKLDKVCAPAVFSSIVGIAQTEFLNQSLRTALAE
jgi:hypothetical protein